MPRASNIAKSEYLAFRTMTQYTCGFRARTVQRAPCNCSRSGSYEAWGAADFSAVIPLDLPPALFCPPLFAAFAIAQRFLFASMIRLRPAALSFRLGVFAAGADPPASLLASAHRFRCAAAIRLRALALMVLRFGGADGDSVSVLEPDKLARSSAICASMRTF